MCTRYNPFEYEDICKISFHQFKNSPSADSLPLFNVKRLDIDLLYY